MRNSQDGESNRVAWIWHEACSSLIVPTLPILLALLIAASGLDAAEPFFFYAENAGVEDPAVKYRLYNVSTRVYLSANLIHLRDGYGQTAIRFAEGEPRSYQSLERWPGMFSRFEGEARTWKRGIPAHRRVQYTAIAANVDGVFGSAIDVPTLTFVVRPGGDVNSLFLESDSAQAIVSEATGAWVVGNFPQWTVKKPRAWQQLLSGAVPVDTAFRTLSTSRVGFAAGAYDRTQPLYGRWRFPRHFSCLGARRIWRFRQSRQPLRANANFVRQDL